MQDSKVKTIAAAVVRKSGDKSVTVVIDYKVKHPKYNKYVRRRTRLAVHDEHNHSKVGDVVEIAQCRPRSKRKSWRLVRILEQKRS
jgi:small subunit ribosomal protein S17